MRHTMNGAIFWPTMYIEVMFVQGNFLALFVCWNCPFTVTKLYCLVNRGTYVWTTCPGLLSGSATAASQTRNLVITSSTYCCYTTKLSQHQILIDLLRFVCAGVI